MKEKTTNTDMNKLITGKDKHKTQQWILFIILFTTYVTTLTILSTIKLLTDTIKQLQPDYYQ